MILPWPDRRAPAKWQPLCTAFVPGLNFVRTLRVHARPRPDRLAVSGEIRLMAGTLSANGGAKCRFGIEPIPERACPSRIVLPSFADQPYYRRPVMKNRHPGPSGSSPARDSGLWVSELVARPDGGFPDRWTCGYVGDRKLRGHGLGCRSPPRHREAHCVVAEPRRTIRSRGQSVSYLREAGEDLWNEVRSAQPIP